MSSDNDVSRLKRSILASLTETLGIDQNTLLNYFINCRGKLTTNHELFLRKLCDILNYLELYGLHDQGNVLKIMRKVRELAKLAPKELRDILSLIVVYLCSQNVIPEVLEWSKDDEPFIRAMAAKCAVELFVKGLLDLEVLREMSEDPSPMVREYLVTSLGAVKGEKKGEVISILRVMLTREKKSSIRAKIMDSLVRLLSEA